MIEKMMQIGVALIAGLGLIFLAQRFLAAGLHGGSASNVIPCFLVLIFVIGMLALAVYTPKQK